MYYAIRQNYRMLWVMVLGLMFGLTGLHALGIEFPAHPASPLERNLEREVENNRNREARDRVDQWLNDRGRAYDGGGVQERPSARDYERAERYFKENGA